MDEVIGVSSLEVEMERPLEMVVKVSRGSGVSPVSGAIAAGLRRFGRLEIRAIGNEAIGRAVKATALAAGYMKEEGCLLAYSIAFFNVPEEGPTEVTGIKLITWVMEG